MVSLQVRFGRDERGWDPGLQTKIAGDFFMERRAVLDLWRLPFRVGRDD
jgi:hypothetical protein